MGTMEDQIRKAVREEIARALGAVGAVADGASQATGEPIDIARGVIANVMERVARDVLANTHPALEPEHTASTAACTCPCRACFGCTEDEYTASTPSTEPVHTITAVPERSRAACTCIRHTHVMGNGDWCGHTGCFCRTPVRARTEHTDVHASTEAPRTCPTCSHGVQASGKCSMHVYLRGVATPCPCMEWVRPEAVVGTQSPAPCPTCEHATHGAGDCGYTAMCLGQVVKCMCMEWVRPEAVVRTGARRVCTLCEHAPHGAGNCGAIEWPATAPCECGGRA